MNVVFYELVCYGCGLLRTRSVTNVVCYEMVCNERGLWCYELVCYEQGRTQGGVGVNPPL